MQVDLSKIMCPFCCEKDTIQDEFATHPDEPAAESIFTCQNCGYWGYSPEGLEYPPDSWDTHINGQVLPKPTY